MFCFLQKGIDSIVERFGESGGHRDQPVEGSACGEPFAFGGFLGGRYHH